ncbi:hypothetical protein HNP84_005431 [Thermocatellispora tengchongensis]|uniref:Uncharacterized protein n=1 Tax=Thermocatellispora tengchongensis TaxID=1073253 RepID=A0A840PEV6_9ACTN|nr:hypothetical protein [Thermocatellispora tengchongensis]MBB5135687.1 hypothetical protein [Thermocatellispora tengchongensis]
MGEDAQAPLGLDVLVENEPAEDVQVVLALGGVAPQGAAHEGVDAVGADQHVAFVHVTVGQVQAYAGFVLVEAVHAPVDLEDAGRERGHKPLVQGGAQQPDEAAAVVADDVAGQADGHPAASADVAELGVAGRAEVVDVDAHQAERLDGRWPQVEDVARRAGLRVALQQDDVVPGLVNGQGGRHPGRPGADDGDPPASGGCHEGSSSEVVQGGRPIASGPKP